MRSQTSAGQVVSTTNGMTLYTYDKDTANQSTCYGECAQNWPPYLANGAYKPFDQMTIVSRTDGTQQWAYDGHPLYTFVQDKAPGEIKGNGFHNNWHVVLVPDLLRSRRDQAAGPAAAHCAGTAANCRARSARLGKRRSGSRKRRDGCDPFCLTRSPPHHVRVAQQELSGPVDIDLMSNHPEADHAQIFADGSMHSGRDAWRRRRRWRRPRNPRSMLTFTQPVAPKAVQLVQERLRQDGGLYRRRRRHLGRRRARRRWSTSSRLIACRSRVQLNQATVATLGIPVEQLAGTSWPSSPSPPSSWAARWPRARSRSSRPVSRI